MGRRDPDVTLARLRPLVDRGRHAYRNRAIGCYAGAAAVLAITAAISGSRFYAQGPMVLVGILALTGAFFHAWYRRLGWDRHPVLVALQRAPETIVRVVREPALGRAALLDERQVSISTRDASILLTVAVADLDALAEALIAHCPDARFDGFGAG